MYRLQYPLFTDLAKVVFRVLVQYVLYQIDLVLHVIFFCCTDHMHVGDRSTFLSLFYRNNLSTFFFLIFYFFLPETTKAADIISSRQEIRMPKVYYE
jgi:hypothetical protein